jgi:hypothetical protein
LTLQEFSLSLMSVLASVDGHFFLKIGVLKLGKFNLNNTIRHIFSIIMLNITNLNAKNPH